ncbi:MAG: hypothetical protein ACI4RD_08295 [Kiritimatiellia bacterium]
MALGKSYLTGRLVKPGRPFSVVDDEKAATHDLVPVVSFLRSRENSFRGATYGVETKTTKWLLDVILTLKQRATGEIVWAKTVCGTCDEQRPISASQFDDNVFHSLMISAVEEAADALVEHFEPQPDESGPAGGGVVPHSAGPVGRAAGSCASMAAPVKPSLAILRPDFRDGVTENEAVMLWGYMESCVDGSAYRVISRADVVRMMEEVAITTSSYLTDPACREKARVGKLATVSKLLAASVGRVGTKYVMTFKVFDASTGEIEAARTDSATSDAIEDLLPVIRGKVAKALAPAPSGTVLAPVVMRVGNPPKYLANEFGARLEAALAGAGVAFKTNGEGSRRLTPCVTAFSVRAVQDGDGCVYRGTIAFSLVLADAAGTPVAAPVTVSLDDVELGRETGAAPSWLTERYGKKLIDAAFGKVSLAALSAASDK